MATPLERMLVRPEHPDPTLGRGIFFALTPKYRSSLTGTILYGHENRTYYLEEAVEDRGVLTRDPHLADVLRGTGYFTEHRHPEDLLDQSLAEVNTPVPNEEATQDG